MNYAKQFFINRDFGLLFAGRLISQVGDGIHYFAMSWLILDLTGSGAALGTLLILASLPGLLLSPFTGVLSDILDRKKIVLSMDILRGLIQLSLAIAYMHNMLSLPLLYSATVILSISGALFNPAISATVPSLVKKEDLVRANARDSFSFSATGIVGPLAGAFLLGAFGYGIVFLINGISFLASALSELFIRFPEQKKTYNAAALTQSDQQQRPVTQFLQSLKEGVSFLWNNPGLRIIVIGGIMLNALLNPVFAVLFPFFGKEVLGLSAQAYGFSQSVLPIGAVLGAVCVSAIAVKVSRVRLVVASVIIQGLLIASLGIAALPIVYTQLPGYGRLLGFASPLLFLGFFNVLVGVPINVMMQELVPDEYRGRVFSLFGSSMNMIAPLAMGIFGVMLDFIPIHFFFFLCGLAAAAIAIGINRSKALHAIFSESQADFPGEVIQSAG
ncbi:MFS transporter [Spirochaeta dissipatitropha]